MILNFLYRYCPPPPMQALYTHSSALLPVKCLSTLLHGRQAMHVNKVAMQAWTKCLLLAVLVKSTNAKLRWSGYIWHEELPKSLLVLLIVLLVVKHVKVVFILYNTCTCTQSWYCTSSCMVYIGTCLGSCETREKGFTPGKCCTWKREKLDNQTTWSCSCKPV